MVNLSTKSMEKTNKAKLAQDESSTRGHLGAGQHLPLCIEKETKHRMSNGSEAATLGVYCTEMTGANETISTFSAGSAQRVWLSR